MSLSNDKPAAEQPIDSRRKYPNFPLLDACDLGNFDAPPLLKPKVNGTPTSYLPDLYFCAEPIQKPQNPDAFLRDAQSRFTIDGAAGGEAFFLARKKKFNFDKFTVVDNAKLIAYWLFPRANDPHNQDRDYEEGY